MKASRLITWLVSAIFCFSLSVNNMAIAQSPSAWPAKSSFGSVYVSTLLMASPVNLSFEQFYHKGWVHLGYMTGLTTVFVEGVNHAVFGGHLTFSMFTGKRNHHFDTKLGFSYTPIRLYSMSGWYDYAPTWMPVITLGYRFQRPDGRTFFRAGISPGGIGVGWGWRIK